MEQHIKVGIGVLIINDKDEILLGHRTETSKDTGGIYEPGTWTLPGGKQEYNETIYEAGIRETKEETNLEVSDLSVFGVSDDISTDRHFITIQMYTKTFKGDIQVMEKEKIDEWKWFSFNNLPDKIYSPSQKTIEEYLKVKNHE